MYTYYYLVQNLIDDFSFYLWLSEDPSIGRILSEKNIGVRSYFLKKRKLCMQSLEEKRKQPTVVTLKQSIFYSTFIRTLRLRIIRRSDQSSWIFLHMYFLTILIMITEQPYWRKVLCGCFHLVCLWLLIPIMKRRAERCALQLYHTSLSTRTI